MLTTSNKDITHWFINGIKFAWFTELQLLWSRNKSPGVGGNIRDCLLVGLKTVLANTKWLRGKKCPVQIALREVREKQTSTINPFFFFTSFLFCNVLLNLKLSLRFLKLNINFYE